MKTNNINLFLDDVRKPHNGYLYSEKKTLEEASGINSIHWQIVRNYEQFVHFVKLHGIPKTISFDNDLDPSHYEKYFESCKSEFFDWTFIQPRMGIHALDYILKQCKTNNLPLPVIYLHTANHIARAEMEKMIEAAKTS